MLTYYKLKLSVTLPDVDIYFDRHNFNVIHHAVTGKKKSISKIILYQLK